MIPSHKDWKTMEIRTYIRVVNRVSFRKMVKGGQNNTYKINGGAKGVHAIVRLLGGHDQISGAHLQDYLFFRGGKH